MTEKHIPTFLNPTPATDAFIKRQAQEKMMEMFPSVQKVLREKR
jgi:hypothetical protein